MKKYIATKIVNAKPMIRLDYLTLQNWPLPEGEDPTEDGYLVEYPPEGKPNHKDFEGYISWCPKFIFEKHNNLLEATQEQVQVQVEPSR